MSKTLIRLSAYATAALLLAGCEASGGRASPLRLAACSAEGSVFEDREFDEWSDLYHSSVDKAVEAHLSSMRGIASQAIECTAEDYHGAIPASSQLQDIADMMPAWENRSDLSESDFSAVLLEFLRVYECALNEHNELLPISDRTNSTGTLLEEQSDTAAFIERERTVARVTLERTLGLLGGFDRLQPLALDIECLKRSSLDLRNAVGLMSDVSSCLPRIWDAKGSLRDLAE